jgi:bacterioferritin-associated ferredoxin
MAIVCHCEVVRERTVVKAIRRGAATLDEVRAACGAATRCGGCTPVVLELVERHASSCEPAAVPDTVSGLGLRSA